MRVVVLGAGFGGLEVAARLSDAVGDDLDCVLIDKADAFVFGYSKLDLLYGKTSAEAIRIPYSDLRKRGVRFRQESIESIDHEQRRVVTDLDAYDADALVIALGADYDTAATPGLDEEGDEFYSFDGAVRARERLESFRSGDAVVGVCGPSFKCPPAPSEAAVLLDEYLRDRGVRDATSITLVMPFGLPIPPSPETSQALLDRFEEADIRFVAQHRIASYDADAKTVALDDGTQLPCDLFLAIPVHTAPAVVDESGLTEDGWIPVDKGTLATKFPGVYAIGDVTSVGTAKAGVFAEGAGRVVADELIAQIRGADPPPPYDGTATCYVEFGDDLVGRVQVDFFSGPSPTGVFFEPSTTITTEKAEFGAERRARWFAPAPAAS
jgi:sulfide:quinone oxidoreductase